MFSEITLNTIIIPFVLGCALFFAARFVPKISLWGALATGIALFCIYVLLEGWPSIPPISSKPKVALMIAGASILISANAFLRINRFVLIVGLLSFALIWIGWVRIGDTTMLPRFIALAAPIVIGGWSFQKFKQQDQSELFWPVTLIAFAIGGALIALFGAYIGLAQAMGAMAAFLGGYALLTYIYLLLRPKMATSVLPHDVYQVVFLCMMSILIAIGLFAPEINTIALAMLALTLVMPAFTKYFTRAPTALQPVLYGLVTAIPVGVAIAIATMSP